MRKLALACILIFLFTSISLIDYNQTSSKFANDTARAKSSGNFDLNLLVIDSENNPLSCDVSIRNPWNQGLIGEYATSSGVVSVQLKDGTGVMIEPSCPYHSVPYQAPYLINSDSNITITANNLSRSLSFLNSLNATINIHSQSSDFEVTGYSENEGILIPENENIEVHVNSSNYTSSIYLIQAGNSNQILNFSGTDQMINGSFENPNKNLDYRINSNLSTLNTAVTCSTTCNYSIPNVVIIGEDTTSSDSFFLSAFQDNSRLDEVVYLQNLNFSVFSDFSQSFQDFSNTASIDLENSTDNILNATYSETMMFDLSQGIPSLPHSQLGIARQSQFLFGKDYTSVIENLSWSDPVSNLCCIYDLRTMNVISSNFQPLYSNHTGFEGNWGWNMNLHMTAESRGLSVSRIGVLFGNDLRQTAPLTISLPQGMEYYSSNGQEWISGSSRTFSVQRNTTSILGEMVINIRENSPPQVQISAITQNGFILDSDAWPTDLSVDYRIQVTDGYLASHNCTTTISSNDEEIFSFEGMESNIPTIDSLTSNQSELVTLSTCIDENNFSSSELNVWRLDSQAPLLDMLRSDVGCSDEFVWLENDTNTSLPNSKFCDYFIIKPGTAPRFIVSSSDDVSDSVSITWSSNISEAWGSNSNFLQETWREAHYANSASDNPDSRRSAAPISSYRLTLNLTDDVGHTSSFDYQIILRSLVTDLVINSDLKVWTENGWELTSSPSVEDVIVLDISDSFHPHLSLSEFNFTLNLDYMAGTDSLTGQIPRYQGDDFFYAFNMSQFSLIDGNALTHGSFEFELLSQISQTEFSDTIEVDVYPQNIPDVYVERILTDNSVEPGVESINVVVVNDGSTSTEAKVCVDDDCIYYFIAGWNGINQGYTIVPMEVNIQPGQRIIVDIEYDLTDEEGSFTGESESYSFSSDIKASTGFSTVEIIFVIIMLGGILSFTITSTKPERSTSTNKTSEEE